MPGRDPEDEKGEKSSGLKASADARRDKRIHGIFGRIKSKKGRGQIDADGLSGKRWTVNDLVNEMQMLGLEPTGLGRFIVSMHKLAVASGVEPTILASIIKDLNTLSGDKPVPIGQLRKKIQQLADEQKLLTKTVSDLMEKKGILEAELAKKGNEKNEDMESQTEHIEVTKRLQESGISFDDLARLSSMLASAKQFGYEPSAIVNLLSDFEAVQKKKHSVEAQLEQLLDSKRIAQQRTLALEQEIEEKKKLLGSADALSRLGFGVKDLDDLSAAIRMISKTRNIDEATAKERLVTDLQSYYANDQELRGRLRTLESLLHEKEDKFTLLESDFHNEKALLDTTSKLIASGLDEKWLLKLRSVIDSYGTDIDSLAKELQTRNSLSASIEGLAKTKKALEEEEMLLRQKVVAVEDQRIKTLSVINDLIVHTPHATRQVEKQLDAIKQVAASAENPEFLVSAQKAIEIIRSKLPSGSPARLVLEHALLALRLESTRRD
jgi:hypothetical protein